MTMFAESAGHTSPASPISISLKNLVGVVGGTLQDSVPHDALIEMGPRRVTIHSQLAEGALFFALKGKRDGHHWVEAALEAGATYAIVSSSYLAEGNRPWLIRVPSPLEALQRLARWYRQQLRCRVIAVAGSIGKTSTKDALVSFLSESEFCYGSPGSFNSQLGVPLSVLWCPHDAASAIIEVAATEPGEFDRLADIVRPTALVVTRAGIRHRRNFGSATDYLRELSGLSRFIPPGGLIISGETSIEFPEEGRAGLHVVSPASAEWPLTLERSGVAGMLIQFREGKGTSRIDVETSSSWLAENVALAAAAAALLGNPPQSQTYSPTSLDLQTWKSPGGVRFLRTAAVDEPMAWRTAVSDARDAAGPTGRVFVALGEQAHNVSKETIHALAGSEHGEPLAVFLTAGRAADYLKSVPRIAVRAFDTSAEVGKALHEEVRSGDVIALFANRGQLLEGVAKELFDAMAPTKLYIDVGAIESNLALLRKQAGGAVVMAVVKAGAYGVDAPELARHLVTAGVDQFAVSHTDEGVALRRSGISKPILVLLATPDELEKAVRSRLMICVHSEDLLGAVLSHSAPAPDVHVEIDTGMHRTGLAPIGVIPAIAALRSAGVRVRGVMTHLAGADDPAMDEFTNGQLSLFTETLATAAAAGIALPPRHALASAGLIRFPGYAMEMVRVGLALLGIPPSADCDAIALVPSLTLLSRLIDRRRLEPGDRVGYGGTYLADRQVVAGVVQLGYYDGIFRSFAATGNVIINGADCPVMGRISMDSMVVDLSNCEDAQVGSDVLVFGSRGSSSQRIEEVAEAMGTIPYEVISRIGPRVQRIFVRH